MKSSPDYVCYLWNKHNPVGIRVNVTDDFGDVTETITRSEAWNVCGNPVIMLEGRSGGYLLERVEKIA